MAQFVASGLTTAVPTAARGPSLYGTTGVRAFVLEIEVWNTTSTAMYVALQRATTVGTRGATVTPVGVPDDAQTAIVTAATTHTADATMVATPIRYGRLGAVDGASVIWTFPEPGIFINNLTTAGLVITCPSGTGQNVVWGFHWRE